MCKCLTQTDILLIVCMQKNNSQICQVIRAPQHCVCLTVNFWIICSLWKNAVKWWPIIIKTKNAVLISCDLCGCKKTSEMVNSKNSFHFIYWMYYALQFAFNLQRRSYAHTRHNDDCNCTIYCISLHFMSCVSHKVFISLIKDTKHIHVFIFE